VFEVLARKSLAEAAKDDVSIPLKRSWTGARHAIASAERHFFQTELKSSEHELMRPASQVAGRRICC
jgi:hypothetical protein